MKILFDNGTPKPIKNIRYQQNLRGRQIALVILSNSQWPRVRLHLDRIAAAVNACIPGSDVEVEIPPNVIPRLLVGRPILAAAAFRGGSAR
jgi:hypothetical protein